MTEREIRKLIERTAKRDAYHAVVQWADGMEKEPKEYGSAYWYAKEKYLNHKVWTDEQDYFYNYATGDVMLKP